MKPCRVCGQEKPLDDFYRAAGGADGYQHRCKVCTRAARKARYYADVGHSREAERTRIRERWKPTKERRLAIVRRYHERNAHKNHARQAVRFALKTGKLVRQPCEVCGLADSQAHHPDYSRKLEVRWLCRKHHWELHRKTA